MTAFERFNTQFNELLAAYRTGDAAEHANARMVGALSVIVPFNADEVSLMRMTDAMEKSMKKEIMRVLAQKDAVA